MYIALGVFLVILSIVVHELSHAIAMKKYGVTINKIGFGIKIPYIPNITWESKWLFPGTIIEINHLPLAAYVAEEQGDIYEEDENTATDDSDEYEEVVNTVDLDITKQSVIYGAGIMGNIIFALLLVIAAIAIRHILYGETLSVLLFKTYNLGMYSSIALLCCLSGLIFIFRNFFCKHVIPTLSLFLIIAIAFSLFENPKEAIGGPIAIGQDIAKNSHNIWEAFGIAALISFSLALINMLPLWPLDGGHIIAAKLDRDKSFLSNYFKAAGGLALLILIFFALGSDTLKIIGYIF